MEIDAVWRIAGVAISPLAGVLVARASVQIPREGEARTAPVAVSRRRYLVLTAACVLVAIWSASLFTGAPAVIAAILGWQLVLIAAIDAEHLLLPHRLTVPLGLMGLAQAAAFEAHELINRLIGAAIGFAALAALAFAYKRLRGREGMGGGDFRLLAAAGAWVGWIGLPTVLVIAAGLGLVLAGVGRLAGQRVGWLQEVPFGTYLAVGLWLAWLYGPIRI